MCACTHVWTWWAQRPSDGLVIPRPDAVGLAGFRGPELPLAPAVNARPCGEPAPASVLLLSLLCAAQRKQLVSGESQDGLRGHPSGRRRVSVKC